LIVLAVSTARAQKVTVHFEPAQADIKWTLGGNIHTTHGTFKLKGGLMTFDAKSGIAEGEILVDADSGESANESRDKRMKDEVLETQRYPQIFFHPAKVSGQLKPGSTQDIVVDGTFNIHGADHPLKLNVKALLDGQRLTATINFTVPYVQWGMKDPSIPLFRVKKEVDVDIVAHGTIETVP
jgi:polyisoprenoid-binding protein YceI